MRYKDGQGADRLNWRQKHRTASSIEHYYYLSVSVASRLAGCACVALSVAVRGSS